ncbi:hypothetical protein [Saccharothrix coeruleofusca]|nr:hypothetical protein [Saccharothrix coeruleofusca]
MVAGPRDGPQGGVMRTPVLGGTVFLGKAVAVEVLARHGVSPWSGP